MCQSPNNFLTDTLSSIGIGPSNTLSHLISGGTDLASGGVMDLFNDQGSNLPGMGVTTNLLNTFGQGDQYAKPITEAVDIAGLTYGAGAGIGALAGAGGSMVPDMGAMGVPGAGADVGADAAAIAPDVSGLANITPDASLLSGLDVPALAGAPAVAPAADVVPSVAPLSSFGLGSGDIAPLGSFGPQDASSILYGAEDTGAPTGMSLTNNPIANNPLKSLLGLNAANSLVKSVETGDLNKAQQNSWNQYLSMLNPPDSVKSARYNKMAGNAINTGNQAGQQLSEQLAARGIRGKGTAAPMGDVSEATRQALSDAYNQIYGNYNIPGAPGPANYSPNAAEIGIGDATSTANYMLPLMALLSKYRSPTLQ